MKSRSPFFTFFVVVTLSIVSALVFIQSRTFAHLFKGVVARFLPADLGIDADFSEFRIKIYPPGLSLKNPKITLKEQNALKMPKGSSVEAERIDFDFRPLQMFTGDIRVHELVIGGGKLHLYAQEEAPSPKAKKPGFKRALPSFHWDELFQVRAEAVVIEDSQATIEWLDTGRTAEIQAKTLRLGQWMGRGGLGYELVADLTHVGGTITEKAPWLSSLESLQANAHVNALGAQLDKIHLKAKGIEVQGDGMIRGNLQNPKDSLTLEADLASQADIAILTAALSNRAAPELSGEAEFNGRVRGNLLKPLETLKLQGEFAAKDFRFRKFHADSIQASGAWTSSPAGGEIELEKAVLSAQEKPRAPGSPSSGGKIEVGALKLNLGSSEPISTKINLVRADVQWLASIGLSDLNPIFPLQLKASGPIEASISLPSKKSPLLVRSRVQLKVEDLVLDNQKLTENRALHRIFKVPAITVEGPIFVDRDAIHFDGLALSLPHSQLKLGGGISFKNGFDLSAAGPASLGDLGEISETPIRGDGTVSVHVHGPKRALLIDVDADMKDAYYIHLNLGDVHGRFTWDDDPNLLWIRDARAVKGTTEYGVDGKLDLGKVSTIGLKANIRKGNIQDFMQVFQELTKELWWFPQSLSGPFDGALTVEGGVDLKELKINGHLSGNAWDYLGERFSKVSMQGGYDRGKYHVSDFKAVKKNGRINGHIEYQDDHFDWDLHTQNFIVGDLDHVAQLDVPIRGKIQVDSSGKGALGDIISESRFQFTDVSVRGSALPPTVVSLSTAGGVHKLRGTFLGAQGSVDAVYDFNPTHQSRIVAQCKRLDFTPMLLLLNPKAIGDLSLAGYVTGSTRLTFSSGQIERADGEVSVDEYLLAKTGTRFQLAQPIRFQMKDGTFDLNDFRIAESGSNPSRSGEAVLSLKSRQSNLEGRVKGDVDLSITEFLTSAIQRASGPADVDFKIGGSIKAPLLNGDVKPQSATAWINGLESPFENISGDIQIRQNAVYVQNLESDLAGGRVTGSGTVLLFADRMPLISLKSELSGNKLRFFPFQYAKVKGSLAVTGDRLPYLVEGKFNIESALSREKVLQQKQAQGLKAVQYTPPPTSQRSGDYPIFKLKVDAIADKGILVQNDLFDAELKAKVTLVNTLEAPRLLGSADLVQGKMIFKDRVFQIQSASGIFDNPTVINPKFNLTGKTDINGIKVQLYASGSLEDYKIELSSTPVMSETDILSLLAIGITAQDTKRMSSADRSSVEQGEAASLLLHSLDFNREVQDKTGIRIQLDESTNTQVGQSVFQRATASDSTTAPRIVIKKQLTKNLDVSYGSTVGVGTSSDRQINAEMKVTPGLSVIGVWDNYESIDSAQEKTTSYSYGLDLKLQRRFK